MLRSESEVQHLQVFQADANFKAVNMHTVKIHTFNPKNQTKDFDLYILCKGLNSGKPLEKTCPNCFVISCLNQAEKDFYYTLAFGLWKAKYFHTFLVGSVIPFLRINDFKTIIKEQAMQVSKNQKAFATDVHKIKIIEQKEKQMQQYMLLLKDTKAALMHRHFKR